MRRDRVWAAVLLAAAALLVAPAPSSAQYVAMGVPYYGGAPSWYAGQPWGPPTSDALSWPGAYSYTQRYYWYGYNWPYRGYFVGKMYLPPPYESSAPASAPASGRRATSSSSQADQTDSYYSYGEAPRAAGTNTARVNVRVPDPGARVWIEGQLTQQRGERREFVSPALEPGSGYRYEVRARWTENGRDVEQTRSVAVRANGVANVDFSTAKP
jgi:uncharacterized protein (TIGR03000 family)